MKLLADFVLVEPQRWPQQKIGSLILPADANVRQSFSLGKVKEKGPGRCLADGGYSSVDVKPGDTIMYFKDGEIPIVLGTEEHFLIREPMIVAILDPNELVETEGEKTDVSN